MKCVICKKNDPVNIIVEANKEMDTVFCVDCRMANFPKHMHQTQYIRYWVACDKKWREENEVCTM